MTEGSIPASPASAPEGCYEGSMKVESNAGAVTTPSGTKVAANKSSRNARFQFGAGSDGQVCQLARSCRREHKEEQAPLHAPVSWMFQLEQHRHNLAHKVHAQKWDSEAGNEELRGESKEEESDDDDANPDKDLTHFQAHEFAQKLNLPAGQVTDAWRQFKRYDSANTGRLTPCEFQLLLRSVLRDRYPQVRDIPRELFKNSHGSAEEISFSDFLTWLSKHAFSEEILLTAEQQSLRAKAREIGVSIPLVENVREQFDSCDFDSNGLLDYQEFRALFCKLMGTSSKFVGEVPDSRVRSFWMEIDSSMDGQVEFNEFLLWYLRYFDHTGTLVGSSPLEDYYESIRPVPKVHSNFWC